MAKKKNNKAPKSGAIVIDAMTVWQAEKPRYNAWQCGHGAHGKRGYDRNAEKRNFKRDMW